MERRAGHHQDSERQRGTGFLGVKNPDSEPPSWVEDEFEVEVCGTAALNVRIEEMGL